MEGFHFLRGAYFAFRHDRSSLVCVNALCIVDSPLTFSGVYFSLCQILSRAINQIASYVEREFSDETSKIMPDCKIWVTNRYQHSGLRDDGEKVFDTLLGMTRGEIELPS